MPVVSRRLVLGLLSAHASVQVFIELASAASAARSGFGEFVFVRLAKSVFAPAGRSRIFCCVLQGWEVVIVVCSRRTAARSGGLFHLCRVVE